MVIMKTFKLKISNDFFSELEGIRKAIQDEYEKIDTRLTKYDYYCNLLFFGQSVWIDRVYVISGKPLPIPYKVEEPRAFFRKLWKLLQNFTIRCART